MKIYKNTVRSNPGCVLFLSYPSFARYVPTAITASAATKINVGHSVNITSESAAPINSETAKWWLTEENSYSPEQMATYFMAFIGKSSV